MVVDNVIDFRFHKPKNTPSKDKTFEYAQQLMSIGCFYLEFSDAIKEGDGNRVYRCWKYLLPIFLSSNRTNYSCEAFNMLYQYECSFSS